MGGDWQPGDLALCLKGGTHTVTGNWYVVSAVSNVGDWDEGCVHLPEDDYPLLRFVGVPHPRGGWCDARRFRKIRPHTPDAEDAETIRLLTRKPATVRA